MAKKTPAPAPSQRYVRFSLSDRLQHVIMLLSFTTLAVTGLVQKFALSPISIFIVRLWGGIENLRATHHVAATILMVVVVVHLVEIGYKAFVLRTRLTMLPGLQDVKDAWKALTFNLGLGKSRPQMGRYSFEEKAEYWALVWGILIMGLTGFMMWNPLATVNLVPGEFIPAAKAAHGAEAILAVLAIIVWHMYAVHLKRFNTSMWTGHLTEGEMLHEHPLELADIKAGVAGRRPPGPVVRARRLVYYPLAVVVAAVLLFAVYGFVRGEETAITTVPPGLATLPVFVPQTPTPLPPTPTPLPSPTPAATSDVPAAAAPVTWEQVGPIFAGRCTACHGPALASAGLALDTYEGAMTGGQIGPVIVSGDPTGSKLIVVQSSGGHAGQLSPEELAIVAAWIEGGAPE
jgi:cytochrome b subunit of formate dehydrogenase/mono/diheme cytochrome c family protein